MLRTIASPMTEPYSAWQAHFAGVEAPDTAGLGLKDKTQPHSEARKRYRAVPGTPIPQTELDPEAES